MGLACHRVGDHKTAMSTTVSTSGVRYPPYLPPPSDYHMYDVVEPLQGGVCRQSAHVRVGKRQKCTWYNSSTVYDTGSMYYSSSSTVLLLYYNYEYCPVVRTRINQQIPRDIVGLYEL